MVICELLGFLVIIIALRTQDSRRTKTHQSSESTSVNPQSS